MIPKVQIESAIGPIIGFFLAEALSKALGQEIVTLCPEFPIRRALVEVSNGGINQSTNIDWSVSTILTARRQLSWPVEAGNEFDCLCG